MTMHNSMMGRGVTAATGDVTGQERGLEAPELAALRDRVLKLEQSLSELKAALWGRY